MDTKKYIFPQLLIQVQIDPLPLPEDNNNRFLVSTNLIILAQ